MWYIINKENKVIARINYLPCMNDLATRNERVIESNVCIELQDAIFEDGTIKKRVVIVPNKFEISIDGKDTDGDGKVEMLTNSSIELTIKEIDAEGKSVKSNTEFYFSIRGAAVEIDKDKYNVIGKKAKLQKGICSFKVLSKEVSDEITIKIEAVDKSVTTCTEIIEVLS